MDSLIKPITKKRLLPTPCWVWCNAGGYDNGWWSAENWWDKYTIGSLTHWHPWQEEAPEETP